MPDRDPQALPKKSFAARLFRLVRVVLLALVFAFFVGFVIGTFLRRDLERPVRHIGALPAEAPFAPRAT